MARTTISPEELHERLGDSNVVIVDCRHSLADFSLGRRSYDEAHITGAFFADVEEDLAGTKTGRNGRHPMPDPETFARFLRAIGVNDDTLVVAYDAGADMFAPRLWFLCRWIGHDDVAVLDGGFTAWQRGGYPVTAAPTQAARDGNVTVRLQPQLVVDAEFVRSRLHSPEMQLVDARASDRFAGQNEFIDHVAGHIPSARNRWFKENFDEAGRLRSPDALREGFVEHGDPEAIVHNCGSGVSAAANYFAMEHAGLPGSRIYGGSWSEWIADPERPIATGSQ